MARTFTKVSVAYVWEVYVLDSGGSPVTGLTNGSFTKKLSKNASYDTTTVTVVEIDSTNLPGRYSITYTPGSTGVWCCTILNSTYGAWQDDAQVVNRLIDDLAFPLTSGRGILVDASGDLEVSSIIAAAVDNILDRSSAVDGKTFRQCMKYMTAILLGKASGGPGSSVFRDMADSADRVSVTATSNGDRSTVTLNG